MPCRHVYSRLALICGGAFAKERWFDVHVCTGGTPEWRVRSGRERQDAGLLGAAGDLGAHVLHRRDPAGAMSRCCGGAVCIAQILLALRSHAPCGSNTSRLWFTPNALQDMVMGPPGQIVQLLLRSSDLDADGVVLLADALQYRGPLPGLTLGPGGLAAWTAGGAVCQTVLA